ncbi:hypothetical protein, conserved [Eimeria brunetti]|uniref:Uncharacterized protein n=1 Tax=Eimeria brunetti TaxID=51314 RepID=U6LGI2_9EIME|nr:hypothetical protein, conserved [Eimeria brunetti]
MYLGCVNPPFFPQVSIRNYGLYLVKNLMHGFRLRHPNDDVGGPQVMAACAQAASLLETYRSLRSAYLHSLMQRDSDAGMSEDSAAWMAGRFNLMLQEDEKVADDKKLRKGIKWCIDSTLVVQKILSQRALTESNEAPTSPGNAFNNLLEASRTGGASHTRRIAQYLLSRCHDESNESVAQNHAWAALSIGLAETFFRGQLTCAINAQEGQETDLSLAKAALSLSWGKVEGEQILEPHVLFLRAVKSIGKSKLLTDPDKKKVQKNCSRIGKPQMQPFFPFYEEPQHFDEVLLSMYSVPVRDGSEPGHGGGGGGTENPPPEAHEQSGSDAHPEPRAGPPNEGAEPSDQPHSRTLPPPPPPPTYREGPPLQAEEEQRPHQSIVPVIHAEPSGEQSHPTAEEEKDQDQPIAPAHPETSSEPPYPRGQPPPPLIPVHREETPLKAEKEQRPDQSTAPAQPVKDEEGTPPETEESSAPTQGEKPHPQGAEEELPVPPSHENDKPISEPNNQEEMEDKPSPVGHPIIPVLPHKGDDNELPKKTPPKQNHGGPHEATPPGPPPALPKAPSTEPADKREKYPGPRSPPVPISQGNSDKAVENNPQPPRRLPERVRVGSANKLFPEVNNSDRKPKPIELRDLDDLGAVE